MLLSDHAEPIADSAAETTGIGIDVIVPIVVDLLPELLKCFQRTETMPLPDFLHANYDPQSGEFDRHLVERMRYQTRLAANRHGQRHLTRKELDVISEAALRRAMDQSPNDLQSYLMEVKL